MGIETSMLRQQSEEYKVSLRRHQKQDQDQDQDPRKM